MVGLGAPDEVISAVQGTADGHHPDMCVDRITAYHHGAHFVVEVEVVLPASMTVRESHDVALSLQHKVRAACLVGCVAWSSFMWYEKHCLLAEAGELLQ